MRDMRTATIATIIATGLLVALTGVGVRHRPLEQVLPPSVALAQPQEPPPPQTCQGEYTFTLGTIERELTECNNWCYADEYASCFRVCLEDANVAKRQAGDDLRACTRARQSR